MSQRIRPCPIRLKTARNPRFADKGRKIKGLRPPIMRPPYLESRQSLLGRFNGAHLSFCKVMVEDVAPDGAFTVFRWFSTNIPPLAGPAGTLLGGFAPSSQRRRRDRFVVKCHNKPSPVRGGIFHAQKLRCAPLKRRATVRRRAATRRTLAPTPWAEAHGYHHVVAPRPRFRRRSATSIRRPHTDTSPR
jgi:hypothetical protein